ncbi:MAG: hypothetical protein ABIH23_01320 [bacterium]
MPVDSKYHVKINGKGYIIADDSFAKQPEKPFNPRFSTGDPSLNDLSFWQFLSQEDWSNGEGQKIFDVLSKYRQSIGWDLRDGKLRLGNRFKSLNPGNDWPAQNSTPSSDLFDTFLESVWGTAEAPGSIWTCASGHDYREQWGYLSNLYNGGGTEDFYPRNISSANQSDGSLGNFHDGLRYRLLAGRGR